MASSSERTLYYRRVRFTQSVGQTMQQLVSQALDGVAKVRDRLEATDPQASAFRVISSKRKTGSFLCGRLTTFARGAHQVVIEDNPDAEDLPLSTVAPPRDDGKKLEYAEGLLYFSIFNDHVALVQSTALKATGLEQHLSWLLREKTKLITNQQGFALCDEPQRATRDRIKKAHVKKVKLGRPLLDEEVNVPLKGKQKGLTRFRASAYMQDFLGGLMDDETFERLKLDERVLDGNLEVWIELRYPKYSRSHSDDSVKLLDDLALALRDFDEDQARLQLADGTTVQGSELKISTKRSVTINDKGLLDEVQLYSDMCDWLETLLKNGAVSD